MTERHATTSTIVDVPGVLVGSVEDSAAATGCSVVLFSQAAVCGVDVRGGATGTRELELLAPTAWIDRVDAIVLTGGSAFGLDAAGGVMQYLEQQGRGVRVGAWSVPIVPAAVLFDLILGDGAIRPDRAMGLEAARRASTARVREGNYGAACGATVGKLGGIEHAMKGGLGSASRTLPDGTVVGVLVAVNAVGDVRDPASGAVVAGRRDVPAQTRTSAPSGASTTLAVVAANVNLRKTQATVVARMAHDGFARTIFPAHTLRDGDIVFAAATGGHDVDPDVVGAIAAELVAEAIVRGTRAARTIGSAIAHRDMCNLAGCPHGDDQ